MCKPACTLMFVVRAFLSAAVSPLHWIHWDARAPLPASRHRALLALNLKFESSHGPGNTDPLPPPPGVHCFTIPVKHRVCVARPRQSSSHGARGRRIVSGSIVLFSREGKRWYVTRSSERSCFACLGDQVCVSIYRTSLVYDYRRTGIFFFLENLFFNFFLSRKCCAPPFDRER